MKWVLVITWLTANAGGGIDITTWPTGRECFEVGERAQVEFSRMYDANIVNFSCAPSHGGTPTCGIDDLEPCK